MATYDYKCSNCESTVEVVHGMNEKPEVLCPCGELMDKYITLASCNIQKYGDGKTMTHWEEVKLRK